MIKNFLDSDREEPVNETESTISGIFGSVPEPLNLHESAGENPSANAEKPVSEPSTESVTLSSAADYKPPTAGQAVRMTGLAWSAGISLFGSIIFMLIIGWFADLLLGTSPWGKVAGIVLGSIIGFIQFFRINSEILRTGKGE